MPLAPSALELWSLDTMIVWMSGISAFTGITYSATFVPDDAAGFAVHQRFFQQCHADAIGDAADQLAARGFGVQNVAAVEGADEAAATDFAKIGIDAHLGELDVEGVHGELLLLLAGFGFGFGFQESLVGAVHRGGDGDLVAAGGDLAALHPHGVTRCVWLGGHGEVLDVVDQRQASGLDAGGNAGHRHRPAGDRRRGLDGQLGAVPGGNGDVLLHRVMVLDRGDVAFNLTSPLSNVPSGSRRLGSGGP